MVIEAACGWHSAMYAWLIAGLRDCANVVAYDRSGLGWSDLSAPINGETRVQDLRTVVESLGLSRRTVYVGHSIAGLYLRLYAKKFSKDIAGLVLLDPTHVLSYRLFPIATPFWVRVKQIAAWSAYHLGAQRLSFAMRLATTYPWVTLPERYRSEIEHLSHEPKQWIAERAELETLPQISRLVMDGDLADIPLLVLTAGHRPDPELQFIADASSFMPQWLILQRDIANLSTRGKQVIYANAGHCDLVTAESHAVDVCAAICEFIGRVGAELQCATR